jgi:hypothetical protein
LLLMFGMLAAAIVLGVRSSREIVSPRKGLLQLAATILFGSSLCMAGLSEMVYQTNSPRVPAEGVVDAVKVHSEGRGYGSDVRLRIASGFLRLRAGGADKRFRPGQRVRLVYRARTGRIQNADFLAADGSVEGSYKSVDFLAPYGLLFFGGMLLVIGWKVYRRDPDGSKLGSSRTRRPSRSPAMR